jgi:hypothetical protein
LLPQDLLSLNIFFLNSQDTTSSNLFVIINDNDLKKIFLTCNKIRALLQKIGSRVMLPSINSNVLALKIIRKTVKSSSISLLVFTFRKGISQLLECDDCACFMSKYSTRNASCIYIVEPSEVRNVV